MGFKIWVDDIRIKPEDYTFWTKSTKDTIELIKIIEETGMSIELIDLDHDAGDYYEQGGDYIKILDWMIENGIKIPCRLHTGNPVGRDNMWRLMKRYGIPEVEYDYD